MGIFPTAEKQTEKKQAEKPTAATVVTELSYMLKEDDSFVLFDASERMMPTENDHYKEVRQTCILPPADAFGTKEYSLKIRGSVSMNGGGKVIIRTDGNDNIEPDLKEFVLGHRYALVRLRSDGKRTWWIVG